MAFNFERFVDTEKSFNPKVTIRKRTGQIGFNSGAINKYSISDYKYIVLFFDAQQQIIGLKLVEKETKGAIEIVHNPSNTYFVAKNFLDKYGIDYQESRRFNLKYNADTKLLLIDLNKGI